MPEGQVTVDRNSFRDGNYGDNDSGKPEQSRSPSMARTGIRPLFAFASAESRRRWHTGVRASVL
jgi:hypothetical protein